MNTERLAEILGANKIVDGIGGEIFDFYIGDLLSWVMGRAAENSCWLTIMSNVNVCAVAKLAECKVVVLCEGVVPDEALANRMRTENITLLSTPLSLFYAAEKIALEKNGINVAL